MTHDVNHITRIDETYTDPEDRRYYRNRNRWETYYFSEKFTVEKIHERYGDAILIKSEYADVKAIPIDEGLIDEILKNVADFLRRRPKYAVELPVAAAYLHSVTAPYWDSRHAEPSLSERVVFAYDGTTMITDHKSDAFGYTVSDAYGNVHDYESPKALYDAFGDSLAEMIMRVLD